MNGGEKLVTEESLDKLYDKLMSGEAHKALGIAKIREFPNLSGEFEKYKIRLRQNPFVPRSSINSQQVFEKNLGLDDDNLYTTFWNIQKADEMAKKMTPTPFPLAMLANSINTSEANLKSHVNGKIDYNKPIYVVAYIPVGQVFIIDGNHRVLKALSEGKSMISAYIFMEGQELEVLTDSHSKLLYKIHHNYGKILAYTNGKINNINFSKTFDLECLFDI